MQKQQHQSSGRSMIHNDMNVIQLANLPNPAIQTYRNACYSNELELQQQQQYTEVFSPVYYRYIPQGSAVCHM